MLIEMVQNNSFLKLNMVNFIETQKSSLKVEVEKMSIVYFNQPFLRFINYYLYQLMPIFGEEDLGWMTEDTPKEKIKNWIDS